MLKSSLTSSYVQVLIVLTLAGCSSSGSDGDIDSSKTKVIGGVSTLNAMVPGATIEGGGSSTTADSEGRFQIDIPRGETTVLTFSHAGYAPAYLALTPETPTLTVTAVIVKITKIASIDVSQGAATIEVQPQLELTFPKDSIQTTSGTAPAGPVDVAVTWIERGAAPALGPVPLFGTDGNETHPLITLGMFEVTLSHEGEPCELVDGKPMTARLPALTSDPETASLFYVDTEQAIWVEEGVATKDGNFWTADIPHLSWWNVDLFYKVPTDRCACVRFVAKNPSGDGIGGVMIRASPTSEYSFGGWTDPDGTLCHECFPAGESLDVYWAVFLGPKSEATIGTVTVTPNATGVRCGAADCQEVPIPVECTKDAHCDGGTCDQGSCVGGGSNSSNSSNNTSGDVFASCNVPDIGLCYEFIGSGATEATAKQVCDAQAAKGTLTLGQSCPSADRLGACHNNAGSAGETATVYYRKLFEGTADQLRSACQQGGGEWRF